MSSSLLVTIFAVEVVVVLVNSIGGTAINNLLWTALNSLPTQLAKDVAAQRNLQQEYLKCRHDLNGTSSQDEFAKWAKLRRQHDKLLEQLEKRKSSLDASKATFDKYATAVRWLGTSGLQYFIPFWFGKAPVFWLPHGWFPYYAEWLISFPRAPLGSVSTTSWQLACAAIMVLLRDTITAVLGVILESPASRERRSNQKQSGKKVNGAATAPAPTTAESKKEL